MENYLIGIDVGTTGTKTMLFSETGRVLSHMYRGYNLSNPAIGYCEQNSEDWWKAVTETVRNVTNHCPSVKNIRAISLSLQGGTIVPVDENGCPLRPAIVWNDRRCNEERQKFIQEIGTEDYMYQTSGWSLGKGLPALELRWLHEHEPATFSKAKMFLSVADYISFRMTGIAAVDLSDAGINQMYDIRKEQYDNEILSFIGVQENRLPKVVHTGEIIGNLTPEAAAELGLTTETVLVAGAHDQYAVAVGAGANHHGDILIGTGTCWVVTALSDQPRFNTGFSQSVAAVNGMWGSISSLSTGGVCLDWMRKKITLGSNTKTCISYAEINNNLQKRSAAAEGLFFYPFSGIYGKNKEFGKATFTGLDLSHDQYDLIYAVMEGVVFQIAWILEKFPEYKRSSIIRLAGGASKSPIWSQIVADVTGHTITIPTVADLACVGAAVIAGTGCGLFNNIQDGYQKLAVSSNVIYPDCSKHEAYLKYFNEYKKSAQKLGELYHFEFPDN